MMSEFQAKTCELVPPTYEKLSGYQLPRYSRRINRSIVWYMKST